MGRAATWYAEAAAAALRRSAPARSTSTGMTASSVAASCLHARGYRRRSTASCAATPDRKRHPLRPSRLRRLIETRWVSVSGTTPVVSAPQTRQAWVGVLVRFLPTYASWLNWIESEFAALRYFALNGADYASHAEQNAAIRGYIRWRNARARPKRHFAINSKIRRTPTSTITSPTFREPALAPPCPWLPVPAIRHRNCAPEH